MDSENLLKNVRKGLWICTISTVFLGIGFVPIIGGVDNLADLDNPFQKLYGILMGMFILFIFSLLLSRFILITKFSLIRRATSLFLLALILGDLAWGFLSITSNSETEILVGIISLICGGVIGTVIGIPVTLLTNVPADGVNIEDSTIKNIIWGFLLGGILGFIGGMLLMVFEIIDDPLIMCYMVITSSIIGLIISLLTLAIIGTFQYLAWTIEVILGGITGTFLSTSLILEGIITPFLSSIFFVAIPAGLILVGKYFYEDFPPLFKKAFNNAVVLIITSIFLTLYGIFCQSMGINPIFTQ
jgi:hypothetical protein